MRQESAPVGWAPERRQGSRPHPLGTRQFTLERFVVQFLNRVSLGVGRARPVREESAIAVVEMLRELVDDGKVQARIDSSISESSPHFRFEIRHCQPR